MHSSEQLVGFSEVPRLAAVADDANGEQWFALQTRARHEKVVAQQLCEKAVTNFLPLVKRVHRWSDRRKTVELPLFSGYVFAKIAPRNDERVRVLRALRSAEFCGSAGLGDSDP